MSRIGKKPIVIDQNINLTVERNMVRISGPKGQMEMRFPSDLTVVRDDHGQIKVESTNKNNSIVGLYRTLIANAIIGAKAGWTKQLELVGVGYRAETSGNKLILHLGFAVPVEIIAPAGISFQINENKISVNGVDKYLVGETAARIRRLKPPEPYKGKGIKYMGEHIRRKAGKAAKTVGAATGGK